MGLRFSIITCTWNSLPYIEECVRSVLSQNYENYEYIFVDGGSHDGTLEFIQNIPRQVKLLRNVQGGIARAMNAGIAEAGGDVVAHMHSDDLYVGPHVFGLVAEQLEATGAAWLFGKVHRIDGEGRILPERHAMPPYSYARQLRRNHIPHAATFVRRSVLQALGGFDERYRLAMDYEMWLRIGKQHEPVQLDEYLAAFRIHSRSATRVHAQQSFKEDFRARMQYALPVQYPEFLLRHAVRRWRLAAAK
ncbi:glycosyltransferase [Aquabacterium sp. A7-Y]|uniref:glycosyltransferase family 2 protein n=1 Tax=Aquabacterium sp. A7-Y TaxID=1349605 RepID=UPI00223CA5D1|nr:glycosyltransferase family 2 protein [Aquabacterium sp. A7-Y]MCW7536928.1 glycosyltransferase [Aquabacterium sp. A7-Y]